MSCARWLELQGPSPLLAFEREARPVGREAWTPGEAGDSVRLRTEGWAVGLRRLGGEGADGIVAPRRMAAEPWALTRPFGQPRRPRAGGLSG